MRRLALMILCGGLVGAFPAARVVTAYPASARAPAKTAAEVIERNVAARGGLEAWRKVETMVWLGHLERKTRDAQHVPFVMQLKRPNLTRFELKEQFSQFTRIFDGVHGWKIRPATDGRPETKSFSPEEVNFARAEFVIDGPLIDCVAKGVTADLDGIETVEGQKAYRLSLRLPSGAQRKVWIDTNTNLEVRSDRPATNPLKPGAPVSVYYRNYGSVEGLQIPRGIETGVAGGTGAEGTDMLVIDRVLINPKLDADAFMPPTVPLRRGTHPPHAQPLNR
ncbi:MAG TPA: hypothetical protein VGO37_07720 [Steroidobacteraceae bacterium]|jgi:hypothetical protein|nr:hypothetical protein [Steroidobacteraceae bacterium]